jgi:hypothetical protein
VQLGKNKKDVASSVECYMREKGSTGEEAVAAIAAMTEHRRRVLDRKCMETDSALLPGVQLVGSIARTSDDIYLRGRERLHLRQPRQGPRHRALPRSHPTLNLELMDDITFYIYTNKRGLDQPSGCWSGLYVYLFLWVYTL